MRAMVLEKQGKPLHLKEVPKPTPLSHQVLIRVHTCAVCRTDLHVADGDLSKPKLPLILGHEIIGSVERLGDDVTSLTCGARVGVPWLGQTCGSCRFCHNGQENLCDAAKFTGYTLDGGFADYTVADAGYCFPIPDAFSDEQAAPLMCAGLIGFRALRAAEPLATGDSLGLYGFGAAAHIVAQVARARGLRIFAFTRSGDRKSQDFAKTLGAHWAGSSIETPSEKLNSAIIFAPVGELVPKALRAVDKAGTVVCAGIHMSDIPAFPYADLWEERHIKSVANLTRQDAKEFLQIAQSANVKTTTRSYKLEDVNIALDDLRAGRIDGAAVVDLTQR